MAKFRNFIRLGVVLLLLSALCEKALAGFGVELDMVFKDSTYQCHFLYVLSPNSTGTNDTLVSFDSLAFNRQQRVSLFFNIPQEQKIKLLMYDTDGHVLESKLFKASPQRTIFRVTVHQHRVKITHKDFLYPQKNEDTKSYFFFLWIFFVFKMLVSGIYILAARLPLRLMAVTSGTFLLSSLVDWFLPLSYIYRLCITALFEFLIIAFVGRKSISWIRVAILVFILNITGFGLIFFSYLWYVFW